MTEVHESDGRDSLMYLIDDMERALSANAFAAALAVALALPDQCAALAAPNNRTSGAKYRAWVAEWVPFRADSQAARDDAAEGIYKWRCRFLHEASTQPSSEEYLPVAFIASRDPGMHFVSVQAYGHTVPTLYVSSVLFCREIAVGVQVWLDNVEHTERFRRNAAKLFRYRPEGNPPSVTGLPMIY